MAFRDLEGKNRRKGAAGTGRRRRMERNKRVNSIRDAQKQFADLKKKQQEKIKKAENRAKAAAGPGKKQPPKPSAPDRSDSEDSDDAPKKKRRKKGAATEEPAKTTSTGFEKAYKPEAPQDTSFKSFFWEGSKPEGEPDEALKQVRKDLGVKVRGVAVPPPVAKPTDAGLPVHFRRIFSGKQGAGLGLEKPTPIQAQVWPAALCGVDIIGIAPTGSGKTLAYLVPAVPHILGQDKGDSAVPTHTVGSGKSSGVICLVLVPTRELAKQVSDACGGGGSGGWLRRLYGLRSGAVYGGTGKEVQLDSMVTLGVPQVLAATPGRLLDLLSLDVLSLNKVSYLVLDEADRMLALGFEPQLSAILKGIRPNRQVLLFSATFPQKLRTAAENWMSAQRVIIRVSAMELTGDAEKGQEVGEDNEDDDDEDELDTAGDRPEGEGGQDGEPGGPSTLTVSPTVHQTVEVCSNLTKQQKLVQLLRQIRARETEANARQRSAVLIFCSQIKVLRATAKVLERTGERCAALHSEIPQVAREQSLDDLKSGKVDTLVATDVAARGLHVGRLRHVVNFDFPRSLELYCHRIGRVGRQGVEGWAYSFLTKDENHHATGLVSLLERCKQPVSTRLRALSTGEEVGDEEPDEGMAAGFGPIPKASASTAPPRRELVPGDAVQLQGLQSAPQLNGTRARLCRWLPESRRWEAILDGPDGEIKALKPENLLVLGPPPKREKLAVGTRVALWGLGKAQHLNGLKGHIRRQVPKTDRWEVVLDNTSEVKAVCDINLQIVVPASPGKPAGGPSSDKDAKGVAKQDDGTDADAQDAEEGEEEPMEFESEEDEERLGNKKAYLLRKERQRRERKEQPQRQTSQPGKKSKKKSKEKLKKAKERKKEAARAAAAKPANKRERIPWS